MSETPWTPGPWRAGFAENCFAVPPEDEVELAILPHPNLDAVEVYGKRRDYNSQTEFDANARLISAAPEMAEALDELIRIDMNLSGQKRDDAMEDLIEKAKAALSKARGQS